MQLWVVWYHRLIGETDGPTLITDTACTATSCRFPSWHTDKYLDTRRKIMGRQFCQKDAEYGHWRRRAHFAHHIPLSFVFGRVVDTHRNLYPRGRLRETSRRKFNYA
jgi:phosphoribosylaminoimidazole-succinocarboxamide synthase